MIFAVLEGWLLQLRETDSSFVFIIFAILLGKYEVLPSWMLNSAIFKVGCGPECPTASMRQIWSKSVKPLGRYHDLTVFESVRRRHLGF